jgi:hypothetical protein
MAIEEKSLADVLEFVRGMTDGQIKQIDVGGVALLHSKETIEVEDLQAIVDKYAKGPRRIEAHIQLTDVDSLTSYLARFGDPFGVPADDPILIVAEIKAARIVAKIDYHTHDSPSWCGHTATLISQRTPEWGAFSNVNGKFQTQDEFARFLEKYSSWIIQPDAATVVELVENLEGTTTGTWSAKPNRTNGNFKFSHEEETITTVTVPVKLLIEIKPFYHSKSEPIGVRIQHKFVGGKPQFALIIDNIEEVEYEALLQTIQEVETATGLPVLVGP